MKNRRRINRQRQTTMNRSGTETCTAQKKVGGRDKHARNEGSDSLYDPDSRRANSHRLASCDHQFGFCRERNTERL